MTFLFLQVLKLYAWEESFIAKVTGYRGKELKQLRATMLLDASFSFGWVCTPFIVSYFQKHFRKFMARFS